jgi:hypothetical chaperone protein
MPGWSFRAFGSHTFQFDAFPCYGAGAMNLESNVGATSSAAAGRPSPERRPVGACGIDFGTSNSAAAIVDGDRSHVLALQDGRQSIPTAVFFSFEDDSVAYGREAMRRHLAHDPGRLMRSLKSILGTSLFEEKTQVRLRRYLFAEIVTGFLRFLRQACAPGMAGEPRRVVLGRPAFFVDDDPEADMRAQRQLESAAAGAGFTEIAFQFEPIAAALHYETSVGREEIALVADIGGGTSDFSVVRVSPQRSLAADRKADILSCSGIHIGGTDFDRLLSLAKLMPLLGFRTGMKTKNMEVPSWYYHDLSTWHRVNALYDHKVLPDMRRVRREAVEPDKLDRLLDVVKLRKGHELLGRIEDAKIALSARDRAEVALAELSAGLSLDIAATQFEQAIGPALGKVVAKAREAVQLAGLAAGDINTVFLTGGSSSIPSFKAALAAALPDARMVEGDAFGSVAAGLALDAERKFGGTR